MPRRPDKDCRGDSHNGGAGGGAARKLIGRTAEGIIGLIATPAGDSRKLSKVPTEMTSRRKIP